MEAMMYAMSRFSSWTITLAAFCVLSASSAALHGQAVGKHVALGVASDWTHRHVLYPSSNNYAVMARIQKDPRWVHDWYLRHPETWWPDRPRDTRKPAKGSQRDWSYSLGTTTFEPLFDFSFSIGPQTGYGSLNVSDQLNGQYLATAGSLTVGGTYDIGTYPLYPGGPSVFTSPSGQFIYDNLLFPAYPSTNPSIDFDGLLFRNSSGFEVNIWGNGPSAYEYDDLGYSHDVTGSPFNVSIDPGGGQTYPAKFLFDVTAAPSCTNDYVVVGIPADPASGGQANLVGVNNLYSEPGGSGYCAGTGPAVKFAYASGTGQIPAAVSLSQDGTRIAYIENLQTGRSYFHSLTIGTTGSNGTSATAAVVPGAGNNAVDASILLSPDGGATNQSSTNSPFVMYTGNDAADVAYATTYSGLDGGSGYLYKLGNVFNGAPTIVWKVAIDAIPSAPIYDTVSNKIFFTDSDGRIDNVTDSGSSPSVVYGTVVASGATSQNAVVIDSTNQMIYASFNSNGTNAIVVQAPTSMASTVTVPVGAATTTFTGPYSPDFNNAFYAGSGTPVMYVAGTGTGTLPTLYGIGFTGAGLLNPSSVASTPLATGMADSSSMTEFYNASLHKDYLFVGVTNNCLATAGGSAGCVLSLDITSGFPTVNAGSTALAAPGGTTGIVVDNDSALSQASSIYYATKSGAALVKATQSALN
jgi:hypothetical protein